MIGELSILLVLPFLLLLVGLSIPTVSKGNRRFTGWEIAAMVMSFAMGPFLCFLALYAGYGSIIAVPYAGLILAIVAVLVARTERPLLVGLAAIFVYIAGMIYIFAWMRALATDNLATILMLSAVMILATLAFCLPLQAAVRSRKRKAGSEEVSG